MSSTLLTDNIFWGMLALVSTAVGMVYWSHKQIAGRAHIVPGLLQYRRTIYTRTSGPHSFPSERARDHHPERRVELPLPSLPPISVFVSPILYPKGILGVSGPFRISVTHTMARNFQGSGENSAQPGYRTHDCLFHLKYSIIFQWNLNHANITHRFKSISHTL